MASVDWKKFWQDAWEIDLDPKKSFPYFEPITVEEAAKKLSKSLEVNSLAVLDTYKRTLRFLNDNN